MDSNEQLNRLRIGIITLCSKKDNCNNCPFFMSGCVFGNEKPKTWENRPDIKISSTREELREFAEDILGEPLPELEPKEQKPKFQIKQQNNAQEPQAPLSTTEVNNTHGSWEIRTTVSGVFTKYVFICTKCGYEKESVLSIPPGACPECSKHATT